MKRRQHEGHDVVRERGGTRTRPAKTPSGRCRRNGRGILSHKLFWFYSNVMCALEKLFSCAVSFRLFGITPLRSLKRCGQYIHAGPQIFLDFSCLAAFAMYPSLMLIYQSPALLLRCPIKPSEWLVNDATALRGYFSFALSNSNPDLSGSRDHLARRARLSSHECRQGTYTLVLCL
jgi:hypothetical protein